MAVFMSGGTPDGSGPHPLLNDLPEVIHLPTRVGRHRELRAAVELLGVELDSDARPGSDTTPAEAQHPRRELRGLAG
ncbi:araC family transcriptional regulator [Planomonospora sphaerica]|uniref:AraC family transcriptional regulator n=1 Tax=Planomonospora sphaerica TaxID=161355 RepID=A0A171CXH5_9ACTN|nr:araC family transcriptional regulator [Planomonospora sphaerica]